MNRFISNLKGKIDTYSKTETETKLDNVRELLENFVGFTAETVTTLPEEGCEHVLYFLEQDSSGVDKDYKVYIYLDGGYELIGRNTINMQPYTTVGEFNTMVAQYNNHTHSYATKEWVNELLGVGISATVTLEASESIIQQGDTTVLTATVLDSDGEPVPNVEVDFSSVGSDITNSSLGSSITNSNGEATLNYTGTGNGDTIITAETDNITSNNLTIEDCYWWDNCNTDRVSEYCPISNNKNYIDTLIHTDNCYTVIRANGIDDTLFYIPNSNELSSFIFESEILVVSRSHTWNNGIDIVDGLYENTLLLRNYTSSKGVSKIDDGTWSEIYRPTGTLTLNKWYTLRLTVNFPLYTAEIIDDNGNTIYTFSSSITWMNTVNYFALSVSSANVTCKWRNIKIKPI